MKTVSMPSITEGRWGGLRQTCRYGTPPQPFCTCPCLTTPWRPSGGPWTFQRRAQEHKAWSETHVPWLVRLGKSRWEGPPGPEVCSDRTVRDTASVKKAGPWCDRRGPQRKGQGGGRMHADPILRHLPVGRQPKVGEATSPKAAGAPPLLRCTEAPAGSRQAPLRKRASLAFSEAILRMSASVRTMRQDGGGR